MIRETRENGQAVFEEVATYVRGTLLLPRDRGYHEPSDSSDTEDEEEEGRMPPPEIALVEHGVVVEEEAAAVGEVVSSRQARRLRRRLAWVQIRRDNSEGWFDLVAQEMLEPCTGWVAVRRNAGIVCDQHGEDVFWFILICPGEQQQRLSED